MHIHGEVSRGTFRVKQGHDPADVETGLTPIEVEYPATVHETITYVWLHDQIDHLYGDLKAAIKKHLQMHAQTGLPCAVCRSRPLPDVAVGDIE